MSHYCWRFQEAMLPYIPQDIPYPEIEALRILRDAVPTHIRQFVPTPALYATVGSLIDDILEAETIAQTVHAQERTDEFQVPMEPQYEVGSSSAPEEDDAGQPEPQHEAGPLFPEDPIPAVPIQEIPAQEAADPMDADEASDDDVVAIDPPEDPPVIVISSDDEDDEDDDDPEDWDDLDDPEEFPLEDEPDEIAFGDGDEAADQDSDSDVSVISLEIVV